MSTNNVDNNTGQCPIGGVIGYNSSYTPSLPTNYLNCDGSLISQSTYPELYSVIGQTYFNLNFSSATSNFGGRTISNAHYGSDGNWVLAGGYKTTGSEFATGTATVPTGTWTYAGHGGGWGQTGLYFNGTYWCASYFDDSSHKGIATATNPTSTWTRKNINIELLGVWFGNGYWVSCGTGGVLYTATDPTGTWTSRTANLGTNQLRSCAYGNGYWVVVGANGSLATATDPTTTWTSRTSGFGSNAILCVAYGNGYWVAVGANGSLATATDPTTTWTSRTSGFGSSTINGIIYANGVWVATGDSGKVFYAMDPTGTWTNAAQVLTSGRLFIPGFGNSYLVVGADNGDLIYTSIFDATTSFKLPNISNSIIRFK